MGGIRSGRRQAEVRTVDPASAPTSHLETERPTSRELSLFSSASKIEEILPHFFVFAEVAEEWSVVVRSVGSVGRLFLPPLPAEEQKSWKNVPEEVEENKETSPTNLFITFSLDFQNHH